MPALAKRCQMMRGTAAGRRELHHRHHNAIIKWRNANLLSAALCGSSMVTLNLNPVNATAYSVVPRLTKNQTVQLGWNVKCSRARAN